MKNETPILHCLPTQDANGDRRVVNDVDEGDGVCLWQGCTRCVRPRVGNLFEVDVYLVRSCLYLGNFCAADCYIRCILTELRHNLLFYSRGKTVDMGWNMLPEVEVAATHIEGIVKRSTISKKALILEAFFAPFL